MPIYLDTRGHSNLGIGICARCSQKFPLDELHSDPNSPGLMVCRADMDEFDPYRLPARDTEDISLPFVRPDVPLNMPDDDGSILYLVATEQPSVVITLESGNVGIIASGVS